MQVPWREADGKRGCKKQEVKEIDEVKEPKESSRAKRTGRGDVNPERLPDKIGEGRASGVDHSQSSINCSITM